MEIKLEHKKSNIILNEIEFNGVPDNLSSSFLLRLIKILNGEYLIVNFNSSDKIFNLDNDRKIYDINGNVLAIEYTDRLKLENDKSILDELFVAKGFFSEKLDNGRQIPELYGNFEYNGKYYLILNARNKTINELSDISYKGVILNPDKYLNIKQSIRETSGKVGELIK